MQNTNIVVDVQRKMIKSCVDETFFIFDVSLS